MRSWRAVVKQLEFESVAFDEVGGEVDFATDLERIRPFATYRGNHGGLETHTVAPEAKGLLKVADTDADVMRIDGHCSPDVCAPIWRARECRSAKEAPAEVSGVDNSASD